MPPSNRSFRPTPSARWAGLGLLALAIALPAAAGPRPDRVAHLRDAPALTQVRLFLPLALREHSLPGHLGAVQAEPTAAVGGLVGPTDVQGGFAYTVFGAALLVVDLGLPQRPVEVGRLALPRRPSALEVAGDRVYLVRHSELWVVDVSDPRRPRELSRTDLRTAPGGDPAPLALHDVFVSGHFAYLADDNGSGAQVVDVADPARPRWLATTCAGDADSVYVADRTVFVTNDDGELCGADVTDPARPAELWRVEFDASWYVVVAGRTAYVLGQAPGGPGGEAVTALWLVDLADRRRPAIVGMVPAPVGPVHVADGQAYMATATAGLRVVDVSTPARPVVVAERPWPRPLGEALPTGDQVLVVDPADGLVLLDRRRPGLPEVGALRPGAFAAGQVALDGVNLHLVSGTDGVQVLDDGLRRVGRYGGAEARRLALAGGHAYLASGPLGLRIYDIADPGAARQVGALLDGRTLPDGAPLEIADVALSAGRAYLAAGAGGLWVADVSDPAAPAVLGRLPELRARRLVVDGTRVLATDDTGLQVVDVAEPARPRRLAELPLDGAGTAHAAPLALVGAIAYVGTPGHLHTVDLSDPSAPRRIGSLDVAAGAFAELSWQGPLLAAARNYWDGRTDVALLDVSAPTSPREVGRLPGAGTATLGLLLRGNTLFTGEGAAGLRLATLH